MSDNSEMYARRQVKTAQFKAQSRKMACHSDERYDLYYTGGMACKLATNIPKAKQGEVIQKWVRNHYSILHLQWVRHGEEL